MTHTPGPCIDCDDGACTMNCGPRKQADQVIYRTPLGYVAQVLHGNRVFYRAMSANNICLFESYSPALACNYADWFFESKTSQKARAAIAKATGE